MALIDHVFIQLLIYILGFVGLLLILYYIAIAGSEEESED